MGKDVKGELRKLGSLEINILIICTYCYCLLMLKLYYVQELFPIKVEKGSPSMQSSMKITYFIP